MFSTAQYLYDEAVASVAGIEEHWCDPRNPSDVLELGEEMCRTAHHYVELLSEAVRLEKGGYLFDAEEKIEEARLHAASAEVIASQFFEASVAHAQDGRDVWLGGESLIAALGGMDLGF